MYYLSNGQKLGIFDTREEYWNLIKSAKVSIYTTSGMDDDKATGSAFHQVTPRFLELLASGCHVICRYENNSDTDYYELEKFSRSVEDYIEFEKQMDYYLSHEIDLNKYIKYLNKHYTSVRVAQLDDIINKISLVSR